MRLDAVALIISASTCISNGATGVDGIDTLESTEGFCSLELQLGEATTGIFSVIPHAEVIKHGKETLHPLVAEFPRPSLAAKLRKLGYGGRLPLTTGRRPRRLPTTLGGGSAARERD